MRSVSIGTLAAWRSRPGNAAGRQAGFSLIEALVALALILGFAAVLGPHLFHARRIVAHAGDRLAAQVLLRSLINAPFSRSNMANVVREGEAGGLRWRLVTEPIAGGMSSPQVRPTWTTVRVIASVSWAPGQVVTAETVRLANAE